MQPASLRSGTIPPLRERCNFYRNSFAGRLQAGGHPAASEANPASAPSQLTASSGAKFSFHSSRTTATSGKRMGRRITQYSNGVIPKQQDIRRCSRLADRLKTGLRKCPATISNLSYG